MAATNKNTFQVGKYKVIWSRSFELWDVKTLSGRIVQSFKYKVDARSFAKKNQK